MESIHTSILKTLYISQSLSIADISYSVGKSIPIVTKAVQQLINDGYIINNGHRASTGGRRANNYVINTQKIGEIVTVVIDRYLVKISIYDFSNQLISSEIKLDINQLDDQKKYKVIRDALQKLLNENQNLNIISIGITMPGFVDSQTSVNNSYPTDSPIYNLPSQLEKEFGIKTYIENDSSAIAIAEKHFGKAKNSKHALIINLTWGVGLGILVDNKLFRGNDGFAGEFSHIPLAEESKMCSCGKKGCLEVEASLESAIDYIQESLNAGEISNISSILETKNKSEILNVLLDAYNNGDQLTIHAIKKIGYMLGKGIATLIHILNPETIIISGIGAAFGKILLPEIQSAIHIYCIPRLAQRTSIQISETNNIQNIATVCIAVLQNNNLIN